MNLDFSLRLSHCSQLLAGKQEEMKEREKKKFQNGYRMKSSKILKGGKIEILRSRNFGIVICIRERKWLMMPNFVMTSCCCRGADFRDFLGFNTFFSLFHFQITLLGG